TSLGRGSPVGKRSHTQAVHDALGTEVNLLDVLRKRASGIIARAEPRPGTARKCFSLKRADLQHCSSGGSCTCRCSSDRRGRRKRWSRPNGGGWRRRSRWWRRRGTGGLYRRRRRGRWRRGTGGLHRCRCWRRRRRCRAWRGFGGTEPHWRSFGRGDGRRLRRQFRCLGLLVRWYRLTVDLQPGIGRAAAGLGRRYAHRLCLRLDDNGSAGPSTRNALVIRKPNNTSERGQHDEGNDDQERNTRALLVDLLVREVIEGNLLSHRLVNSSLLV